MRTEAVIGSVFSETPNVAQMRASYRINKPPEVSGIALQDNSFYSPLFNELSNLLDPMAESQLMRNQEMLVSK